jgi:hypothetical protein
MEKDILERIKAATVAMATLNISNKDKPFSIHGTGFCIISRGIVITCEHVLSSFMDRPLRERISEAGEPKQDSESHLIGTLTSSFTKGIISSIIPSPNTPQEY